MILDLPRFIATERPYWTELETFLHSLDIRMRGKLSVEEAARLHYLYQRAGSGLQRLATFSAEARAREYLEALVARAYAEIHQTARKPVAFHPWPWLSQTFPVTFRRHWNAFLLTVALTVAGTVFGAAAVIVDSDAKPMLMPFSNLRGSPAERVKQEEAPAGAGRITGHRTSFSADLMTHNIRVAFTTFALGLTWGFGTVVLLFYNGVTLGAVAADYISAGYTPFLFGWLMPHGVIEIPAILVAGQGGFVLAGALIGRGRRQRLRDVSKDLTTLAGGAAVMLVWAGVIEAFFSQYHAPVLPYSVKIAFGAVELLALIAYFAKAGRT